MSNFADIPTTALALLIGVSGGCDSDDDPEAGEFARQGYVYDDLVTQGYVAMRKFLTARGCEIADGSVCVEKHLDRLVCLKSIKEFFKREPHAPHFICYLGDGDVDNHGAWRCSDGNGISFADVHKLWLESGNSTGKRGTLFLYCDSCSAGSFCEDAAESSAEFYVQASCANGESGTEFTSTWIKAHQRSGDQRKDTIDQFERQNQQQPTYCSPMAATIDRQKTLCVSRCLTVELFGMRALESQQMPVGNTEVQTRARIHQEPAEALRDSLPSPELQLIVNQLAERPGWKDAPEFRQLLQSMKDLCKREQRRGGPNVEDDISEIVDVLQKFAADPLSSPIILLQKFCVEFG